MITYSSVYNILKDLTLTGEEVYVGGGLLRDLDHGKPINDIDLYFTDDDPNMETIIDVLKYHVPLGGVPDFSNTTKTSNYTSCPYIKTVYRSNNAPIDLIFTNKEFMLDVVSAFDTSISQIFAEWESATDEVSVWVSNKYTDYKNSGKWYRYMDKHTSPNRIQKLKNKYGMCIDVDKCPSNLSFIYYKTLREMMP